MSFDLMMGREDGKRLVVIPIAPPFNFNNAVRSRERREMRPRGTFEASII
jgi:hypothetical protein